MLRSPASVSAPRVSSKVAALAAHHGCQLWKNIGSPDEPSSAEAADKQNAKLVNWRLQQE
jgi:hypothetical protein